MWLAQASLQAYVFAAFTFSGLKIAHLKLINSSGTPVNFQLEMKMHSKKVCLSLLTRLARHVLAVSAALLLSLTAAGNTLAGPMFTASLDAIQEVPSNASSATGFASFAFNDTLTELSYELSVFGLFDVTMAHIHLAPAGSNGPVVLWLYPFMPPAQLIAGETNGLLAQRTVTETGLVGTLAGQSLSLLLAEMNAGNAYVNVHTLTFPGGEIRGQVQQVSAPAMLPVIAAGLMLLATLRRRRVPGQVR